MRNARVKMSISLQSSVVFILVACLQGKEINVSSYLEVIRKTVVGMIEDISPLITFILRKLW